MSKKTCKCGHNKKAHGYYYGCYICDCQRFETSKQPLPEAPKEGE